MHRRLFVLAAAAAVAWPSGTPLAQQPGRSYRVGWVATSNSFGEPYALEFVKRLAELGFVEGRNLTLERRHADNKLEQLPGIAAEMGRTRSDAYFGGGAEAGLAAMVQASRDTPIVFVAVDFDPVATGDVASLARPGGRITGITALQSQLPAERLELLKEMLPEASRIAVLANDQTGAQLVPVQGTARHLGVSLHVVDLKRPPFDYEGALAEMVRSKSEALFVLGSGLWVPARRRLPELAQKSGLPTMFHQAQWAEAGGLMSYGFSFPVMYRRGAEMLASVLRGTRPRDIPMEQPTLYELVLNARTARALGVRIPQSLLIRASRVIE